MSDKAAVKLAKISPIYIVDDINDTIAYYTQKLGFKTLHVANDEQNEPFFVMLARDDISIMFKKIAPGVHPRSISQFAVKDTAIYDAFWHVQNPAGLLEDFKGKGVKIIKDLKDTSYGTKEFVFQDLNGYHFLCGD